ncbi:MAG: protein TolR [Chromatiales bacterium]|nr:protein TolR [Chromatiales bacterium]
MRTLQRNKAIAEINVVPYIDVMLVLLIIFMVTVPLIQQGVEIELPESNSELLPQDSEQEPLIITVDTVGNFFINQGSRANQPLPEETLIREATILLEQNPDDTVYVRGDRNAPYKHVMKAMVALQKAGTAKIGLVTQPIAE